MMESTASLDLAASLRRLYPALLTFARARLGEHDAQDAVQETVRRALEAAGSVRPDLPFERWAFTIAANVIRDMARRARTRRDLAPESEPLPILDPAGALVRAEDVGRILRCLRDLDPAESAPILLHLVYGVPQTEVAALMDISVEHLRVRLFRTIRKIRKALGE